MKKILFIAIISLFSLSLFSQVKNVNPDPNGEPWIVGGWKSPSNAELNAIPQLEIESQYKTKSLPSSLDNSTLKYFRPIFNQTDGCCAQASGVAYNFTYEINRARNLASTFSGSQYPTHHTYNFLNSGSGSNGSWYGEGWSIIKANGCPTVLTYGGLAQSANYWLSGYDDYQSGMENRVTEIFNIDVSTPEGLETLKYWMYNHADGSADGGIVNFAAGVGGMNYNTHNHIVTSWAYSVDHAMTFVGWDDDISYDFNNDGNITNDIDITGDGVVNMQDWEEGAMIMVNSWGAYWEDNGKAYVPYRLLALPVSEGGIGASNMVSSIKVRPEYDAFAIMNVEMQHNSRNLIKIIAGVSTNLSADEPDEIMTFPLFSYQGGDYNMQGTSSSPIEISLDITPLLSYVNSGVEAKFFVQIVENDPNFVGSGTVQTFSVENSTGTQTVSSQSNVSIINNNTTTLSVNATFDFDAPEISTTTLTDGVVNTNYSEQLLVTGGETPYTWDIKIDYEESEISETYTNITSNQLTPDNNDDGYATQILDFAFPFYAETYETVYVRTDGSIAFEPGFSYLRSEEAIKNEKIISVFASDLMIYPAENDGLFYEGDENSATFRWKTSLYDQPDKNIDVSIILYPSGEIKLLYGPDITENLSWASGVSKGDGINSYITTNSGDYSPSDKELLIHGTDFPGGMSIDKDGVFSGTPTEIGDWDINFVITDFNNIFDTKAINFSVQTVNIDDFTETNIQVYPNPATDNITISCESIDLANIQIIDISGKIIINRNIQFNNNSTSIDISNLESGVYNLIINSAKFNEKTKLIIQ